MRLIYLLLGFLLFVSLLISLSIWRQPKVVDEGLCELELGISFSPRYAESLGLDAREAYRAVLDELQPRGIRLPLYWSEVEKENDIFDFSDIEWYLQEAEKREIKIVLTIGYRNFRYPECYPPDWVKSLNNKDFEEELLEFLSTVVQRFSDTEFGQTIEAWQVENEPFDLPIYRRWCRHFSAQLIEREMEVVRVSDPVHRPIILTFGGEVFLRSLWKETIRKADIFGVSFYPRTILPGGVVVQTYHLGPFSPRNIAKERRFAVNLGKKFWVVEMQAEPWGENPATISPKLLKENYELLVEFGGAERVYLWGVEWWYKKLLEGEDGLWSVAKGLINPIP